MDNLESNNDLVELFNLFIENRCNTAQIDRLMIHFGHPESISELRILVEKELARRPEVYSDDIDAILRRADDNIRARILNSSKRKSKLIWLSAAAAVAIFIGVVSFLWLRQLDMKGIEAPIIAVNSLEENDVAPGTNQATLHLSDGKTINLDDAEVWNGDADQAAFDTRNGELNYNGRLGSGDNNWNVLEVPKAGTYVMNLPDGTKVWLNADSKLYFPNRFASDQRIVKVEGEVFFDVKRDVSRPFVVQVGDLDVNVLGTSFNIKTQGTNQVSTTLVTGLIEASYKGQKKKIIPGNKMVLDLVSGVMKVSSADLESATAWKNGYFYFKDENMTQILRDIGRWYDLEIAVLGMLPTGAYSGSIDRNSSLKAVLAMLESVSDCTFKIEGSKLIVNVIN